MTGMTGWLVWSLTIALAQGTGEASTFPCPDGFLACEVDGQRLMAGMTHDQSGMPVTAGSRLGWFDLRPTVVFDPFRAATIAPGPTGSPDPQPVARPTPVDQALAVASPRAQRVRSPNKDRSPPPLVVEPAPCEVRALEGRAAVGRLTAEERSCLRTDARSIDQAPTRRNARSRLLLADAFARGATDEHDALLSYHLEYIDQSDPDLAMRQARVSARAGRPMDSLRWADTALENRAAWNGSAFVRKVSAAYELRAKVAHDAWDQRANATRFPDAEQSAANDAARNLAKTLAREWLDYARSAEIPSTTALELCRTTGDRAFCR